MAAMEPPIRSRGRGPFASLPARKGAAMERIELRIYWGNCEKGKAVRPAAVHVRLKQFAYGCFACCARPLTLGFAEERRRGAVFEGSPCRKS